tara:strand:+ start:519 stop:674 length:156 start_codon:yes stop_codon:yes gene_type:complete
MDILINIISFLIVCSILKDAWNFNAIKSAERNIKDKQDLIKRLNIKKIKRG